MGKKQSVKEKLQLLIWSAFLILKMLLRKEAIQEITCGEPEVFWSGFGGDSNAHG